MSGLRPPPPSPSEPANFPSGSKTPFVRGFPLSVSGPFSLCEPTLSLAAISVALSPHPKIPFLADKARRLTSGFCRTGSQTSAALVTAVFWGVR